jgi:hypothetical protein
MSLRTVLQLFFNQTVVLYFLMLLIGFYLTVSVWGNPYLWVFLDWGRQTSFLVGCRTLSCIPVVWCFGIVYTYMFAVVLGFGTRVARTSFVSRQ